MSKRVKDCKNVPVLHYLTDAVTLICLFAAPSSSGVGHVTRLGQ